MQSTMAPEAMAVKAELSVSKHRFVGGYLYFRDAADSEHPTNVKMHPTDFEGFSEKARLSLKRAAELRTKIQQLQAEADGCEAEGRFCARGCQAVENV